MKIRLKKLLSKYKNKIFSFIAVVAFMPLFAYESSALTIYNSEVVVPGGDGAASAALWVDTGNTDRVQINEYHYFDFTPTAGVTDSLSLAFSGYSWDIAFDTANYDYWVQMIVEADKNMTYFPSNFYVTKYQSNTSSSANVTVPLTDVTISQYDGVQSASFMNRFMCLGKLPDDFAGSFRTIATTGASANIPSKVSIFVACHRFPKGTDVSAVSSIISAINNQTSALGGKLDDTNDFINNGNGSTSGIVSGNNSAIDNLDDVVSQYRETEQTFFDDFNTNQQAITSDIVGWSWGGLVNCADWVGSTLTDYYNNMGDFRQYIIYPLMLGIALFFLGRGGSIIGHLFRKPTETTVNTKSVFRREGNTRYTTTTTSRQGGVWRK